MTTIAWLWRTLKCVVGVHELVRAHEPGDAAVEARWYCACLHCPYQTRGWTLPRAR